MKPLILLLISMLAVVCAADPQFESPGRLDAGFGTNGIARIFAPAKRMYGIATTVQPDGRIIVVGRGEESYTSDFGYFSLSRFNSDGSIDAGFGTGGVVIIQGNLHDQPSDVALQPDGKIVVAGDIYNNGYANFGIMRFNPDGSPDVSFDGDGMVMTPVGPFLWDSQAFSVAIQPDGKIVAAGWDLDDFAVVRYNSDGSLDSGFGNNGQVITDVGPGDAAIESIALQPDGRIVAAGFNYPQNYYDIALARYNADGSLDTSFGNSGLILDSISSKHDSLNAVAIQQDGKILAAGSADSKLLIIRYNANGSRDPGFGENGVVLAVLGSGASTASAISLQQDNKIVASAYTSEGCGVARFNPDGSFDPSFDFDGALITPSASAGITPSDLELQPDGKILVSGSFFNGTDWGFTVLRYLGGSTGTCSPGLFCDDFEDNALPTDWTFLKAGWSEAGGELIASGAKKSQALASPAFAGCISCTIDTSLRSSGGTGNRVWLQAWYQDKANLVELLVKEEADRWILRQKAGGKIVAKAKASSQILPGVDYAVRLSYDGSFFHVYVDDSLLITLEPAAFPSGTIGYQVKGTSAAFQYVDVY